MRARSSKLLSGASVFAVIAAFGAAGSVSANQTFTGPLWTDPILNADTGSTAINTNAKILADSNNDSFYNGIGMVDITVDASYLSGAIHNAASGAITTGVGVVVQNNSQIDGGIWNQGTIGGSTSGVTINTGSAVETQFRNDGTISGVSNGVLLGLNSAMNGGITNNGVITGAIGFNMSGASSELRGGIANKSSGQIIGTTTAAISVSGLGAQLKGGITNDGLIQGQNSANGIQLTNGTITGGITNNATGVIEATGASATAIFVSGATFTGNITNSGRILATNTSGHAVVVSGTTVFTGDITNNATGTISASKTAVTVNNTSFTGNVTNNGRINSTTSDGIWVGATTFIGNITNGATGVINAWQGINVSGGTFTGDVVNNGTITTHGVSGIWIDATTAFTGNVTNNGVIDAQSGIGVAIGATVPLTGTITNNATGIIAGKVDGIAINGNVTGGIVNAGTITAKTGAAINAGSATAAHTITQTGGLIQGNNNGTITTALNLVNGFADTFNGDGGTVDGNVNADPAGSDNFVMHASGTFSYLRGTVTGINQFDMAGTGTAVLGAQSRGATGTGATINAATMTQSAGTVYLDDNTAVNLTGAYTQTAGSLEFQLTSTVGTHGVINATSAALGGKIAAYIQGNTFATTGGNTFTYQNVIQGGPITGTFTNAADIDTNSLFFKGVALVNPSDVDIVLTRQSFANALSLPSLSLNQQQIGGQLDTIYNAGGYSASFTNLFNYILSQPSGSQAEVQRVYDELAGAEHASIQQVGLRVSQDFADQVGARLADMRGSSGTGMASLGLRRYADATPAGTASDISAPGGMRGSMSMWGRGYGSWTNNTGDAEAQSYDQNGHGFAGGVDFAVDSRWNIGGALGWSSNDVKFATPSDNANVDAFQFAGYGNYSTGNFYLDAAIALGFQDVNATRLLDLGTAGTSVAISNYNANTFGARSEVGANWNAGRLVVQPFVTVAYANTSTDSFAESGAGPFSLLVSSSDASSLTSTLGARFSGSWSAGGIRLVPDAQIAWRHEYLDDRQNFTGAFLESPAARFPIISAEQSRDSVVATAGLGAQVSKNLVLFLDYNGLFSNTTTTHTASGGLRATW